MNLFRLVFRNLQGSSFRNWVVFICAGLVAFFAITATILIGGARSSLQLALNRLGADIIVVPAGSESLMENAYLMGVPAAIWMPTSVRAQVDTVPGVAATSSQLFLASLRGALCCSVPDMFLIAFDPASDFSIQPWLMEHLGEGLDVGEAVGGSYVFLPPGEDSILLYGYDVHLAANLEPTGTGIDQSMFFTVDTAQELAEASYTLAEAPLKIPDGEISSVMVRVAPDADPHVVAERIRAAIPDVEPVESSNLFSTHRARLNGLLNSVAGLLGLTWLLSLGLIGLVFSMIINERHREIGVMRALGATRGKLFTSLVLEGLVLALVGAMAGVGLGVLVVALFRNAIIDWLGTPFLLPDPGAFLLLVLGGFAVALLTVIPAMLAPALRATYREPAEAMRK